MKGRPLPKGHRKPTTYIYMIWYDMIWYDMIWYDILYIYYIHMIMIIWDCRFILVYKGLGMPTKHHIHSTASATTAAASSTSTSADKCATAHLSPIVHFMILCLLTLLSLFMWDFMAKSRIGAFFAIEFARFRRSESWQIPWLFHSYI